VSEELSPMNAAEIYDRVFDVYKKTFGKQLGYAAVVGLMAGMAMGFVLAGLSVALLLLPFAGFTIPGGVVVIAYALVFAPLVLFWQAALSAGAIWFSRQALSGEKINLPVYNLFSIIGRAAAALLAQVLLALPYLAFMGGFIYFLFRYIPVFNSVWFSRVYFIFFILWGLAVTAGFFIYMHMFSLAIAAAVNERVLLFEAVRRSFALIKKDFWRLFALRVLWVLMVFALAAAAQGLLSLLPAISGLLLAGAGFSVQIMLLLQLLGGLASVVITFALGPLDGILTAVIYFNQRIKHEGLRNAF
jgi:hypothetical protein